MRYPLECHWGQGILPRMRRKATVESLRLFMRELAAAAVPSNRFGPFLLDFRLWTKGD